MTIYLYVKTHNITGLKYLGKTSAANPHTYTGSGKYWKRHLAKYGNDYTTEIVRECADNNEAAEWGLYFSTLWNVVESSEWANLAPETGDGGDRGHLTSDFNKFHQQKLVEEGKHHWLGGTYQAATNTRRVLAGTHNLLGDTNPSHRRLANGTHNFIGMNTRRVAEGSHNFVGSQSPSQVEWVCPHCNKRGKGKGNYTKWHGNMCKKAAN